MGGGNKNRTDVNRRVLEGEGERERGLSLQTSAVPAIEKRRETLGQAVTDLGSDSYSLFPSSVTNPGQVTYLIVQA